MPAVLSSTGTWTALNSPNTGMSRATHDNVPGMANIHSGTSTGEFGNISDETLQFLGMMANALGLHFWQAHAIVMAELTALRSYGAPSRKDESGALAPIGSGTAVLA